MVAEELFPLMDILSIDVEDYFMVSAFEEVVKRDEWDRYAPRVEPNTRRLLDMLESIPAAAESHAEGVVPDVSPPQPRSTRATFFCLGWVAQRHPRLIQEIHRRGHEVASHGFGHRMVTSLTPAQFRLEVRQSKALLEDLTGAEVWGYRAPSYSITATTLWALEILIDEGFRYDSSIFPVRHDRYGMHQAPRAPFVILLNGEGSLRFAPLAVHCGHGRAAGRGRGKGAAVPRDSLLEFPLSTLRVGGQNLPVAGGGYFRFFPLWFTQWAQRRIWRRDRLPFIFYIHPWEIDPGQPKVAGLSLRSRVRHYLNMSRTEERLRRMIAQGRFTSFKDFIRERVTGACEAMGTGLAGGCTEGRCPSA